MYIYIYIYIYTHTHTHTQIYIYEYIYIYILLEKAMATHSSTCLENPMDGGAWSAAVYGVTKSRTWLHFDFSLSCIGEGNGNPLQCSCLEDPRDGGAWWGAVYGVTQSQTRLKRLSSSIYTLLFHVHTYIWWRRKWDPTPVFLPGKSHGRRSLANYNPWVTTSQKRLSNFTFTYIWWSLIYN